MKKKIPPQPSQTSVKFITKKLVPKPKASLKIKSVVVDDESPPSELKTKSSVFDRLGVGDVSSTTPNLESNNSSTAESRKVIDFFLVLINISTNILISF